MQAPDGNKYRVEGPVGATDDQVREQILKQHPDSGKPKDYSLLEKADNAVVGFKDKLGETIKGAVKGVGQLATDVGSIATGLVESRDTPTGQAVGALASGVKKEVTQPLAQTGRDIVSAGAGAVDSVSRKLRDPSGRGIGELGEQVVEAIPAVRGAASLAKMGTTALKEMGTTAESRAAASLEKIKPEAIKIHEGATETAGLPKSEDFRTPADQHLETKVKKVASEKLKGLLKKRAEENDPLWDRYRATAEELEKRGAHFTLTQEGADLIGDLQEIEAGGGATEGTKYSDRFREMAAKLRERLSGVDKEDYRRKPVTMEVVDEELRSLRASQADAGPNGFSAVERQRFKALGDRLEGALEKWVGKDNYPRAAYKEASKEINKWGTKLGQVLTGRQDVEYLGADAAPGEYQGKIARKVFSSTENVDEAISLLGPDTVKLMGEQFVANSLRTKNAAQALEWIGQNPWIQRFPASYDKALKYAMVLAERSGKAESLHAVREARKAFAKKMGVAAVGGGAAAAGFYGYQELTGGAR
jgi:hypothetical protein